MTTMQENKTAKSGFRFSNVIQKLGPLLGLIILILIVSVLNPSFLEPLNILNLLRQVSINALIAFGMTFVILTGGIDLSVGSILALSSAFCSKYDVVWSRSDLVHHHWCSTRWCHGYGERTNDYQR